MEDAFAYASDVVARAAAAGDRAAELCARIEQDSLRTFLEPEGAVEQLAATIEEALPVFQAAGDDFGLFIAYSGLVQVEHMHARMDAMLEAVDHAVEHSEAGGRPPARGASFEVRGRGAPKRQHAGFRPARLAGRAGGAGARSYLQMHRAEALAMIARFAEARAILTELRAAARRPGLGDPARTGDRL